VAVVALLRCGWTLPVDSLRSFSVWARQTHVHSSNGSGAGDYGGGQPMWLLGLTLAPSLRTFCGEGCRRSTFRSPLSRGWVVLDPVRPGCPSIVPGGLSRSQNTYTVPGRSLKSCNEEYELTRCGRVHWDSKQRQLGMMAPSWLGWDCAQSRT